MERKREESTDLLKSKTFKQTINKQKTNIMRQKTSVNKPKSAIRRIQTSVESRTKSPLDLKKQQTLTNVHTNHVNPTANLVKQQT